VKKLLKLGGVERPMGGVGWSPWTGYDSGCPRP
jgi:hypothetical protein